MAEEVHLVVLQWIIDLERNRLAAGVREGLGRPVGSAVDHVDLLAINGILLHRELILVRLARSGVELPTDGSRRMVHAIAKSQNRKHQQRADLNNVDGNVYGGRAVDAAIGNVGYS